MSKQPKARIAKKKKRKIGAKPGDRIALINARLIDPESGRDEAGGLTIRKGKIAEIGPQLKDSAPEDYKKIDCGGLVLCPGLIDMLVTTGEPGFEHRETLATASRAAAAGGVTTLICMPDTNPVIDDVALVDFIERRARDTAVVHVHPMAAATRGLEGSEMTEVGLLKDAGAVGFTNGKSSIASARVMRRLLAYSRDFGALIVHNIEEPELANGGVMNEGEVSSRLGLPGIPASAEVIMLERDLELVEDTNSRYHAAQISTAASLDVIRRARERGLKVTCGVSINHLNLNENDIGSYRTFFKMRPPLRREEDRQAMIAGLGSGEIDVVVSAHDPKDADVKRRPFAEAEDGAIGLETLLPAALRLYHNGTVDLMTLLRALTCNPANLLNLGAGRLKEGAPADLIVVDLETPWVVDPDMLHSKSKNTPFDESHLQGRAVLTLVNGNTVYSLGKSR
jgi:dihydroorotase